MAEILSVRTRTSSAQPRSDVKATAQSPHLKVGDLFRASKLPIGSRSVRNCRNGALDKAVQSFHTPAHPKRLYRIGNLNQEVRGGMVQRMEPRKRWRVPIALAVMVLAAACSGSTSGSPTTSSQIIVGQVAEPKSLDPGAVTAVN